ncbi:hypothetical protein SAMCFNEI73_pC0207 (plasmid) [Sinorhizobium americanum]|uniref:Uncharacterized protein n=1 Tax=Sinorhizobium americanum TaxID=194963 RepID=A0A1L3LUZ9_9HYPH|nr:hypothetical protein SAMCFNEI73_pC0207 [Sinorhizobium americanum]
MNDAISQLAKTAASKSINFCISRMSVSTTARLGEESPFVA